MGYREFIDSVGVVWKVWNTVPLAGAVLAGEMQNGWLTFESMTCSLRRLAPVPDDWQLLSAEKLEALCTKAAAVRPATLSGEVPMDAVEPNDVPRAWNASNRNY
jgi:hypothetical protein